MMQDEQQLMAEEEEQPAEEEQQLEADGSAGEDEDGADAGGDGDVDSLFAGLSVASLIEAQEDELTALSDLLEMEEKQEEAAVVSTASLKAAMTSALGELRSELATTCDQIVQQLDAARHTDKVDTAELATAQAELDAERAKVAEEQARRSEKQATRHRAASDLERTTTQVAEARSQIKQNIVIVEKCEKEIQQCKEKLQQVSVRARGPAASKEKRIAQADSTAC
jgi:hypothetical protein